MILWKNFRIKLYPNEEQFQKLMSICNTFRYCYNWGLAFSNRYKAQNLNSPPSFYTLSDEFTRFRSIHPWLQDYDISTCRYALMNVRTAFDKFFAHETSYPKFKSKKKFKSVNQKFKVRGDRLTFWGPKNELVHIPGFGRFKKDLIYCGGNHKIPLTGEFHNVYIKYDGLDFWLSMSISIEVDDPIVTSTEIFGVDVGIRTPATLSNGMTFDMSKNRIALLERRRYTYDKLLQRDIHRRQYVADRTKTKYENIPKSKNAVKRERKRLDNLKRISDSYKYQYHNISKQIAELDFEILVIEDLRITNMLHDYHYLGNEIAQSRLKILLNFIKYKTEERGKKIIKAPSDFPSTQKCSKCGTLHKVGKSKIFVCPNCGLVIDRDLNAAINLRNYGVSVLSEASQ